LQTLSNQNMDKVSNVDLRYGSLLIPRSLSNGSLYL